MLQWVKKKKKNSEDPELQINETKQIYIYNHTIEIYKRKMGYPKKNYMAILYGCWNLPNSFRYCKK